MTSPASRPPAATSQQQRAGLGVDAARPADAGRRPDGSTSTSRAGRDLRVPTSAPASKRPRAERLVARLEAAPASASRSASRSIGRPPESSRRLVIDAARSGGKSAGRPVGVDADADDRAWPAGPSAPMTASPSTPADLAQRAVVPTATRSLGHFSASVPSRQAGDVLGRVEHGQGDDGRQAPGVPGGQRRAAGSPPSTRSAAPGGAGQRPVEPAATGGLLVGDRDGRPRATPSAEPGAHDALGRVDAREALEPRDERRLTAVRRAADGRPPLRRRPSRAARARKARVQRPRGARRRRPRR